MSWIVNIIKLLLIFVWMAVCATLSFLILIFTFNTDTVLKIVPGKIWAPVVFFIARIKIKIIGREHIDRENYYIYVGNHVSHIDIPATVTAINVPLYFMLKKELKKVPFLGWYSWMLGMIFVDRKNKSQARDSLLKAGELIKSGKNVLVYPEGTRSPDGQVQLFRKGAFSIAKNSEIGMVPFAIDGTFDILKKGSFLIQPGTVTVSIGKPIKFDELRGKSEIEMADLLKSKVIELKAALKKN